MKFRLKLAKILTIALALILLLESPAVAAVFQLSGRVTDQSGSPLANVTVEVLDPATSAIVASANH